MALVKGTNSYSTVAEADAYFADRLDVLAWLNAGESTKAQALITATQQLDELVWTGTAADPDQALAFPRSGSFFDPKLGIEVVLDSVVPERITKATNEQAYHLILNSGVLDNAGSVESITVGSISLTKISSASKISTVAKTLVKPLRLASAVNTWWRAN